jgi:hypothetical protein
VTRKGCFPTFFHPREKYTISFIFCTYFISFFFNYFILTTKLFMMNKIYSFGLKLYIILCYKHYTINLVFTKLYTEQQLEQADGTLGIYTEIKNKNQKHTSYIRTNKKIMRWEDSRKLAASGLSCPPPAAAPCFWNRILISSSFGEEELAEESHKVATGSSRLTTAREEAAAAMLSAMDAATSAAERNAASPPQGSAASASVVPSRPPRNAAAVTSLHPSTTSSSRQGT